MTICDRKVVDEILMWKCFHFQAIPSGDDSDSDSDQLQNEVVTTNGKLGSSVIDDNAVVFKDALQITIFEVNNNGRLYDNC